MEKFSHFTFGSFLFFLILSVLIPFSAFSAEVIYYVSPGGNDSNDGLSKERPFQTIQKALDLVQAGDSIELAEGIYPQDFVTKRPGEDSRPITVAGPEDAIVTGAGNEAVAEISYGYYTLRGFTIDGLFEYSGKNGYRDTLILAESVAGLRNVGIIDMTLKNAGSECLNLRNVAGGAEISGNVTENCNMLASPAANSEAEPAPQAGEESGVSETGAEGKENIEEIKSLVNSETLFGNSKNFSEGYGPEKLWDGCYEGDSYGTGGCTSLSRDGDPLWLEFDFGKPYDLYEVRLFGDADGSWVSQSWSASYKNEATAPWTRLFSGKNAQINGWTNQTMNITARYFRVEIRGRGVEGVSSGRAQAKELEIYGKESANKEFKNVYSQVERILKPASIPPAGLSASAGGGAKSVFSSLNGGNAQGSVTKNSEETEKTAENPSEENSAPEDKSSGPVNSSSAPYVALFTVALLVSLLVFRKLAKNLGFVS